MSVNKQQTNLYEDIFRYTLQFYEIGTGLYKDIVSCGSGFLYEEDNSIYIFTAKHLKDNLAETRLVTPAYVNIQTKRCTGYCPSFNLIEALKCKDDYLFLGAEGKGIDVLLSRIKDPNIHFMFYKRNDDNDELIPIGEMGKFKSIITPTLIGEYYFGGFVERCTPNQQNIIEGTPVEYHCEYLKSCFDDKYYEFELDSPVHSKKLQELSGAPIFDANMNLVSMLISGPENSNIVHGLNMSYVMKQVSMQELFANSLGGQYSRKDVFIIPDFYAND